MPVSMSEEELESLQKVFDMTAALEPMEWEIFSPRTSKANTALFLKRMAAAKLSRRGAYLVVVMTIAMKDRDKILEKVEQFGETTWYREVKDFFELHTVQHTFESKMLEDKIAVVDIPSSVPPITAHAWARMQQAENLVPSVFIQNLWAAQFNFDDHLMERQKAWETHFWNTVVTVGSQSYKKGFNEADYLKKASDSYPLLCPDGSVFQGNTTYDLEALEDWLNLFRNMAIVAGKYNTKGPKPLDISCTWKKIASVQLRRPPDMPGPSHESDGDMDHLPREQIIYKVPVTPTLYELPISPHEVEIYKILYGSNSTLSLREKRSQFNNRYRNATRAQIEALEKTGLMKINHGEGGSGHN